MHTTVPADSFGAMIEPGEMMLLVAELTRVT